MDDSGTIFSNGPVDGYADGEEPVVFHHREGEFRKYESKVYSDMATGKNQPKRGMFRVLVGTRMNRTIFFAMILTFGVVMCVNLFGRKSHEDVIEGVFCSMSAFSFGDDVYVSVEMKKKSGSKKSLPEVLVRDLSLDVSAIDSDGAESNKSHQEFSFDSSKEDQVCRMSFRNYDISNIKAVVTCLETTKELTCKVLSR